MLESFFAWFGLPGSFVMAMLLSLLSMVLALVNRDLCGLFAMLAMFFSAAGDIVLMNFKGWFSRLHGLAFVLGGVLFVIAHLLYMTAFLTRINKLGTTYLNGGFWCAVGLSVATFVLLTSLSVKNGQFGIGKTALFLLYLSAITANCATVFSYSVSAPGMGKIAALGAVSFFISDLFIGLERVSGIESAVHSKLIWVFYPIGQLLLLLGTL